MSKYCEYCRHSLEDSFNCNPCVHLDVRQYADNTVVLEDLFILSRSLVFCKGEPEWLEKEDKKDDSREVCTNNQGKQHS